MATLADQFDLRPRHILTAFDFAAPHREVTEEQIAANVRTAEHARELVARPRRAESVSQACGSPAPGHLMPLPTATRSTPSTATTQFAAYTKPALTKHKLTRSSGFAGASFGKGSLSAMATSLGVEGHVAWAAAMT